MGIAQFRGWTARQMHEDRSWTDWLTPEQVQGFKQSVEHAQDLNKPYLEMTREDFPLSQTCRDVLAKAVATTQGPWGLSLVKGFPVHEWDENQTRLAYWGMGLHMGVARPQNKVADVLGDVRDAGQSYYAKQNGRGYNTNAKLDFHVDSGDIVGLLCRRTARSGGRSMVTSSRAIYEAICQRYPHLLATMREPLHYHWQGIMSVLDEPYYACPVVAGTGEDFVFRFNLKNIVAAQRDFPQLARLTDTQQELIDVLLSMFPDPEFCYSMDLEPGDMQLVNNYTVIHSRESFEDFEEPDQRRHLIRLWLAIPGNKQLPPEVQAPIKSVIANSVRGGMRGKGVGDDFLAYEQRQAADLGMDASYYAKNPR